MFEDLRPKAVLFDFYGTLVDIETDEHRHEPWETVAKLLKYRGSRATGEMLRLWYLDYVKNALDRSGEEYPDVDIVPIFGQLIAHAGVHDEDGLAKTVAQLFRSQSIVYQLRTFPESIEVLEDLSRKGFVLGLVSDSQEPYLLPELHESRLDRFFDLDKVVISSRYGYRKPDPRLMQVALERLGIAPSDAAYVGDSWMRDVEGAAKVGMHPIWIRRDKPADLPRRDVKVYTIRNLNELKAIRPPR